MLCSEKNASFRICRYLIASISKRLCCNKITNPGQIAIQNITRCAIRVTVIGLEVSGGKDHRSIKTFEHIGNAVTALIDFNAVFIRFGLNNPLQVDLAVFLKGMDEPLPAGEGIEIKKGEVLLFDPGL